MSASQKIPFAQSMSQFTRMRVQDAIQLTGRALPCEVVSVDGAIVTVQFLMDSLYTLPQVTCPLFGPEYIRYPIQLGDKGVCFPSDFYLGGVSGLGGGTADLSQPANLSALVFFPIGNKTWFDVDPDAVTIYGPNGVVLRDTGGATTITLTPAGVAIMCESSWSLVTGAFSFTADSSGAFMIQGVAGTIKGNPLLLEDATNKTGPSTMAAAWSAFISAFNSHIHSGPGGNTGAPTVSYTGGNIAPSI